MKRAFRLLTGGKRKGQPRVRAEALQRSDDLRESARLHRLGTDTQWNALGELAKRWPARPTLNDFPALAQMVGQPSAIPQQKPEKTSGDPILPQTLINKKPTGNKSKIEKLRAA